MPVQFDHTGAAVTLGSDAKGLTSGGTPVVPYADIVASEALAAGDLVNIWNDSGTAKVRKADGAVDGREAHGLVRSAVSLNSNATVFFGGLITGLSGLTPGQQYLSVTVPGGVQSTAPTVVTQVWQRVGVAVSATSMYFNPETPILI